MAGSGSSVCMPVMSMESVLDGADPRIWYDRIQGLVEREGAQQQDARIATIKGPRGKSSSWYEPYCLFTDNCESRSSVRK